MLKSFLLFFALLPGSFFAQAIGKLPDTEKSSLSEYIYRIQIYSQKLLSLKQYHIQIIKIYFNFLIEKVGPHSNKITFALSRRHSAAPLAFKMKTKVGGRGGHNVNKHFAINSKYYKGFMNEIVSGKTSGTLEEASAFPLSHGPSPARPFQTA